MNSNLKKSKFRVLRLPIKFPFGFQGITLPYLVILSKDASKTVLNHEIIHCMQINNYGVLRFYWLYFLETYRAYRYYRDFFKAYENNWFEVIAYKLEKNDFYLKYYDEKTKTIKIGYENE